MCYEGPQIWVLDTVGVTLHAFRVQGFRAFWIWILEAHTGAYGCYRLFSQVFSEAEFESA